MKKVRCLMVLVFATSLVLLPFFASFAVRGLTPQSTRRIRKGRKKAIGQTQAEPPPGSLRY